MVYTRNLYSKWFSDAAVDAYMTEIHEETQAWINKLPTGVPIDLHEAGVHSIPLRVIGKLMYGRDLSEERIQLLAQYVALHNEVFGFTSKPETKFPFYRKLPTTENKKLDTFLKLWKEFHMKLFDELKAKGLEGRDDVFSTLAPAVYSGQSEHSEKAVTRLQ